MPERWTVEERVAAPSELHGAWPAAEREPEVRRVAVCRPTAPAIVLGSTQSTEVVDARAARTAGVAVVRRRSGGGAVLVTRDDPVWIDVWVPAGDARWDPDVTGAFGWLGTAWGRALERLGLAGVTVQGRDSGGRTPWGSLVCFGGIGAGEVGVGGRKVVGLAQRRVRSGAWFHTACVHHWDPVPLLELLVLSPGERAAAAEGLSAAAVGVGDLEVGTGAGTPTFEETVDAVLESLELDDPD